MGRRFCHAWLAIPLLVLAGCDGETPVEPITEPGVYERELEVDGRVRSYSVLVPDSWDGTTALPMLVGFHGVPRLYGLDALTDLDERAQAAGVALVLPDGAAPWRDWDLGCDYCTSASRNGVDDLRFLRRLLDRLDAELPVDRERVYLTGFSQGGLFALRAACHLAERVAGVAPVAALLLDLHRGACRDGPPLPALFIHGTEDPEFPWTGREGDLSTSLGAEETLGVWVERNGCESTPDVELLPDRVDDGTRVERRSYPGCATGGAVRLYAVLGGGHTWPDSPFDFSEALGPKTGDINASALILEFVQMGHP